MKVYRYTGTITILSEEPLGPYNRLDTIANRMDTGDLIGTWGIVKEEEIVGRDSIEEALLDVGNDGSFWDLDSEDDE